jgi:hypothetical protein
MITLKHYTIINLLITGLFFFNLFFWHLTFLGFFIGSFFIIVNGFALGTFLKNFSQLEKLSFGVTILFAGILILGSLFFYIYQLNNIAIFLLICVVELSIGTILFFKNKNLPAAHNFNLQEIWHKLLLLRQKITLTNIFDKSVILTSIVFFLDFFALYILWQARTDQAIQSPWQVIPSYFFVIYTLSSFLILIVLMFGNKSKIFYYPAAAFHIFLSLSVALIVYKIGYGFDSFIHQAAEKQIYNTGAISPKPFYYIGQYSLITILSKLFMISPRRVDLFFVPLITAAFLPLQISSIFSHFFKINQRFSLLAGLLFLIVPFREFIVTTPQSMANFFSLIIIFASLLFSISAFPLVFLIILNIAVLFIHPLAGIPITFFVLFVCFFEKLKSLKIKNILTGITFFIACFSLPIAFFINKHFTGIAISLQPSLLKQFLNFWPEFFSSLIIIPRKFNLIFDWLYLYGFNWKIILFAVAIVVFLAVQKKFKIFWAYLFAFVACMVNVFLMRTSIIFEALPTNEQLNYPLRLTELSFYLLLPLILFGFIYFVKQTCQNKFSIRLFSIIFLTFLLSSSFYLSYPRLDNYEPTHGFSVSRSDLNAVLKIEEDAEGHDYIVLANQAVSAAAFYEFGFKKYYPLISKTGRAQYFYSTPTGSPLYQYFLKMIYEAPKAETAKEAGQLVGAEKVYFVVNNYWWHAGHVILEAKKTADKWIAIDGGKIYIFVYLVI